MKIRIRTKFIALMMLLSFTAIALTALSLGKELWKVSEDVSRNYARLYAEQLKANFEGKLNREIALSIKLANTTEITAWMKEEKKTQSVLSAFDEIHQFTNIFQDDNLFIAFSRTNDLYYFNQLTDYTGLKPIGVLSSKVEGDNWYFKTLKTNKEYLISADRDRFLKQMYIRISVKVKDQNNVVWGVAGTSLQMKQFIVKNFSENKSIKSVLINQKGEIVMDSDMSENLSDTSKIKQTKKKNIYKLYNDYKFTDNVKRYLKAPVDTTIMTVNNSNYQYAALTPIANTDWHIVTFFNRNSLYRLEDLINIIIIVFISLVVVVLLNIIIVKRLFVDNFISLKKSIELKEMRQDNKIFGVSRKDEFGELARCIQDMTDRLIKSIPVGIFLFSQKGEFLYGNPYFYEQFGCSDREDLQKRTANNPSLLFKYVEDYEKFKHFIFNETNSPIMQVELRNLNGSIFWAEISISRVIYKPEAWQYEGILINIQDKKAYEKQLVKMATKDKLTGLFNRYYLDQILTDKISFNDRFNNMLSLIVFDIDSFKYVNDTLGHNVGDLVLIHIANLAQKNIRKSDSLIRWGGEEFAIIMQGADLSEAAVAAEKLRNQIESNPPPAVDKITVSIGVAERRAQESFEEWFKRADIALYEAKRCGKNCVIKYDEIADK